MTPRYIDADALAAQLDALAKKERRFVPPSLRGVPGRADGLAEAVRLVREAPAVPDPVRGLVERLVGALAGVVGDGSVREGCNCLCCEGQRAVTEARAYLERTKGGTDNAAG